MARRRRVRSEKDVKTPREPVSAERQYRTGLRRVWKIAEDILAQALEPLLEIWPEPVQDGGYLQPTPGAPRISPGVTGGRRARPIDPRFGTFPGVGGPQEGGIGEPPRGRVIRTAYPERRRRGIFGGQLRVPRSIDSITDSQLRRLWPNTDPSDIREWAPWATSREEVYRLAYPGNAPEPTVFDLEARVQSAIQSARQVPSPPPATVQAIAPRRSPEAFKLRRVPRGALPVLFDQDGNAIPPPPRPSVLSLTTIREQMAWVQQAYGAVLSEGNLAVILGPTGANVAGHSGRDFNRVLAINVRSEVPGLQAMINAWRESNINLIESGITAPWADPKLRPSLLADVSRLIENSHRNGVRVEALAEQIKERFGVADKRAELIARDQVLKLNGQISHQRQRAAGIREYIWVTSKDERVREGHQRLEGTRQSWDSPPNVGNGRHSHPGQDYQCRCVAKPVPPAWLTAE